MFPKIEYKNKEKILSIRFSNRRSVDSAVRGNVVVDYDHEGEVVGVDITSLNFNDFVPAKVWPALSIKAAL